MGNWACWTSIQVYSNNYFILSIFYITITNRSWHIATLSNDKESTKPLCLRSNTKAKDKRKKVWLQRLWSAPCTWPIFLLSLFNIIFISRLIIFTLSLSAFQLVRKCSQKCFSIFHLLLSLFCSPSFFQNFPLVLFFFFFFLLLFPSPGTHYYKNDCNKSAIPISVKKKMQNLQCLLCLVLFEVFCPCIFYVPFAPNFDGYLVQHTHTDITQLATIWRDY